VAAEFAHLHVHTQFSFLSSSVKVNALAERTRELGMNAVAMTDNHNMYGAIRHYKKCRELDLLPILGAELNVARDTGQLDHLVLLASSLEGYQNLVKLVSLGHTDPASDQGPSINLETISGRAKGLICLSGCLGGVAAQSIMEQGPQAGESVLGELRDLFEPGKLFVEIQNHGFPEQAIVNGILSDAAKSLDLPLVATNDVHFMNQDDSAAQLYLECIRRGRTYEEAKPTHHGSNEMYLKSPEEMLATFREYPEAIKNTLRVAEMCRGVELKLGQPMLPHFPLPDGFDTETYFRKVCRDGLEARFKEFQRLGKVFDIDTYNKRLEREMGTILDMGFPGYFLIVWDFIKEAKRLKIPVGPGRGSGAGSLVAYSLGITDLDPLPYNLLFERFLNPERVSMPDFDIDFCMSQRERVIDYVSERYGRESVGQIATFQNLKARSVIKDVARAMGIAAPDSQRIASLVPELGPGVTATISEALEMEPKLKAMVDTDPQIAELINQSKRLEGLTRHAGMHAAGVVISEGPLHDHVPVFKSDVNLVTQYDKNDVEDAGLVKFDFLGLKTLTVIDNAERLINMRPDRKGKPMVVGDLPLTDKATFQLISSGETTGVFQLESSGMQQLLRQLKPDCFEDVVAVVALYRPGPLGTGMVDDFVATKHGRKETRKLDPLIDDVLAPTYGVPVYQEQVMQIAQQLSGYSLGGADMLRRAMGKKKASEMEKQKKTFIEGAAKNGVSAEKAESIFNEIEGFASYGFNKSHSAAYALITYQTAYLKTHFPSEFFAAALTTDKDKIDKVVRTIAEARAWGALVLPPDINASDTNFTVDYAYPQGDAPQKKRSKVHDPYGSRIRFGLGAVRGVGGAALDSVFDVRRDGGDFQDLFDFASRVDGRKLNRGVLEALVQCGAFDSVCEKNGIHRARAFGAVDRALERAKSATRDRESGQSTLFGLFDAGPTQGGGGGESGGDAEFPPAEAWDRLEMLRREKAALGCYVSGHPLFRYGQQVSRIGVIPTAELKDVEPWTAQAVAGVIENYQEKIFKKGGAKAAFFEIEDVYGRVKAKLRGNKIDEFAHLLTGGEPVLVSGKISFPITDEPVEEKEPTVLVDSVMPLSEAVLSATGRMTVRLEIEAISSRQLHTLRDALVENSGSCPVDLQLILEKGEEATLALPQKVKPTDELLGQLERIFGDTVVELS